MKWWNNLLTVKRGLPTYEPGAVVLYASNTGVIKPLSPQCARLCKCLPVNGPVLCRSLAALTQKHVQQWGSRRTGRGTRPGFHQVTACEWQSKGEGIKMTVEMYKHNNIQWCNKVFPHHGDSQYMLCKIGGCAISQSFRLHLSLIVAALVVNND